MIDLATYRSRIGTFMPITKMIKGKAQVERYSASALFLLAIFLATAATALAPRLQCRIRAPSSMSAKAGDGASNGRSARWRSPLSNSTTRNSWVFGKGCHNAGDDIPGADSRRQHATERFNQQHSLDSTERGRRDWYSYTPHNHECQHNNPWYAVTISTQSHPSLSQTRIPTSMHALNTPRQNMPDRE